MEIKIMLYVMPTYQVVDVCRIKDGSLCCRYLGKENKNFVCLKRSEFKRIIDEEHKSFLDKNKNVESDRLPFLGNNCDGYEPMIGNS